MLSEYGQNPLFQFEFIHKPDESFTMRGIGHLEIKGMELSIDCKYLLVSCGLPDNKIVIVDIENRTVLNGAHSTIPLQLKAQ